MRDLRYGLRSIISDPLASVTVILSLGVGMGVAATTFSILNAMALKDLPGVVHQDRLVTFSLRLQTEDGPTQGSLFAWPEVKVLRTHREIFSDVAAAGPMRIAVDGGRGVELVDGEVVSPNYFRVLGARPSLGRFFAGVDADPGPLSEGEAGVAVMSYRYWRSRFGEDPGILGRVLRVNGQPLRVIGVAEEGFTGMTPEDVIDGAQIPLAFWISTSMAETIRPSQVASEPLGMEARWLRPVARLAAGTTVEEMTSALPPLTRELESIHPDHQVRAEIVAGDLVFGPGAGRWRPTLTVLGFMVVPLIVLLVASANAANILLARNTQRRRELAIRTALGADRRDLLRQLLIEGVALAVAAGAVGLITALGARRIAAVFSLHLSMDVPLDGRVLAFTLGTSVFAGLALGFIPALRATGQDAGSGLATGGRGSSQSRRDSRIGDGLVVGQVSLGLLLLVCSGLFVRSTQHGLSVDTGMDEDHLILMSVDMNLLGYTPDEGLRLYDRLLAALEGTPGVEEVALADLPLLQGSPSAAVAPAGGDPEYGPRLAVARVGDGFLHAVGIPLMAGRSLERADVKAGVPVAVLNEAAARRLWPDQDALGRGLRVHGEERAREVVGIVKDSRTTLYENAQPIVYLPREPTYQPRGTLYIRTSASPTRSLDHIRGVVRGLDSRLPVGALEPAREVRRRLLAPWRLGYLAMGFLGGIAVLLAGAGLYGVLAYAVSRRRREIGVRMALGANARSVVLMVLLDAMRLLVLGVGLGFILSATVATLLRGALFGVSPVDFWVYGRVGGILLVVTILAALRPALRATSVEPVRAMDADL